MLSDKDWLKIVTQNARLTKSQRERVRYSIIHEGVPDELRGQLWIKLLDIGQAISVHSENLYDKLCDFDNEEAEN